MRTARLIRARILRPLICLLLLPATSGAVTASLEMRQLLHTSWLEADGAAMGVVHSITQGADGYLWVGTTKGLLRFDGTHFSRPPLRAGQEIPPGQVLTALAAHDGWLWAAGNPKGLWRLRDGLVESYPVKEMAAAWDLAEDRGGAIWIETQRGVFRIPPGGPPHLMTTADGLPDGRILSVAASNAGDGVWVGLEGRLCRWQPGRPAECRAFPGSPQTLYIAGPDEVYAASGRMLVRISGGEAKVVLELSDASILSRAILVDRRGAIWVGTTGGLFRIREGQTERFRRREGLSSDPVWSLFEDREGDVWVGTAGGLDRFRDPRVLHLTTLDGLSGEAITTVDAAPDGAVWIGTVGNGLTRWDRGKATVYSADDGVPGTLVSAIRVTRRGEVWAAGERGFARLEGRRFVPVRSASADRHTEVFSLDDDASGAIWAADQRRGVWRIVGGIAAPVPQLPISDAFRVLGTRDGAVWIGSFAGAVVKWAGERTETFDAQRGVGPGAPRALWEDHAGAVWVGAGRRLTRIREGRVTSWGPRQGLPAEDITGMTEDPKGDLWLATTESVLRIERAQVDGSPDGRPGALRPTRYDSRDGLRLRPLPGMAEPLIAATRDGRVWVAEQYGVGVLDPELLERDTVPPPVHIEHITVDGQTIPWGARSFQGHETRIGYTGISLKAPERVRFRYRLDPIATDWTTADSRREITFVNLSPDRYRFRVVACNLDDVCSPQGAALEFRVEPYFRQTIWFKLLLALALGMSGWALYRVRLAQVKTRLRLVAQERARVTREIHDSLLQGFAGVVLQLEAAARQFDTQPAASKDRLKRALDQADSSMTEARKMLLDMRLPVLEASTLPEALEEAGAEATEGKGATFALRVRGSVAPLPYAAQAAMFLIGREAIRNAANHASASRITANLVYTDQEFRMAIQDNGCGFDPTEKKEGHFGVAGMDERARAVGATLRIDTAPGKGTSVSVAIARTRG